MKRLKTFFDYSYYLSASFFYDKLSWLSLGGDLEYEAVSGAYAWVIIIWVFILILLKTLIMLFFSPFNLKILNSTFVAFIGIFIVVAISLFPNNYSPEQYRKFKKQFSNAVEYKKTKIAVIIFYIVGIVSLILDCYLFVEYR